MNGKTTINNGGTGLAGILGIVFVIMKLMHWGDVSNWSWWWVLSPFWIPAVIVILVFMGIFAYYFIIMKWQNFKYRHNPNSLRYVDGKLMMNSVYKKSKEDKQ